MRAFPSKLNVLFLEKSDFLPIKGRTQELSNLENAFVRHKEITFHVFILYQIHILKLDGIHEIF